ncbi:sensor domain-containing diguanylate cyclase [Vibrio sp. T187]|uniref:transporter substrate-binding domain-containing diguanylate cyclase n=1 Tax=Vibrio TaxID=662 RepID=UPI0010CA01ED|nr:MULTISPECIES: sensor domain-containing diguanylate cyclase [Vibrio]MBW3698503.1 sensor domain-containing diguanylate cyclase [Vibrio sp. T187]
MVNLAKPLYLVLFTILIGWSIKAVYAHEQDKITVANSKAWKPFSYLDESGNPSGILIDFWKAYSEKSGVEIEFVLTDWGASLELVRDNKADAHAGLLWSAPRDEYLDYSDTLFSIDTHLFMVQKYIGTDLNYFLQDDDSASVGVVEGGYEQYFAEKNFPNLRLNLFSNNELMINAAMNGEITAFIADTQVANFYLYSSHNEVKVAPVMFLYSGDIKIAVAEGNQKLLHMLESGFSQISRSERDQILSKWMHIQTVYPPYLIPSIATVIFVMVIFYVFQLKSTVKERTIELEKANRELVRVANTDELTGISNRRHFFYELERLDIGLASVTLMVFDIDDFKYVNDTYGHNVGDLVIKEVAHRADSSLGYKDIFARIGGEEFAIVSFGLDKRVALEKAQAICDAIGKNPFQLDDMSLSVTVSIGCAYYARQPEVILLHDADQLMYQAKQSGKNQVTLQRF